MINNISCVLIVSNAEKTLSKCLNSLNDFSEVIVFINNTNDSSKEIAAKYSNVVIHEGEFTSFGDTRNRAAKLAKNDWIFFLDSDEYIDDSLVKSLIEHDVNEVNVYYFKIYFTFMGRVMTSGFLKPNYFMRMYNRKYNNFEGIVHEHIKLGKNQKIVRRKGKIVHLDPFPIRNNKYITIFKNKHFKYEKLKQKDYHLKKPLFILFIRSVLIFLKLYILKRGFIDGSSGFYSNYYMCKFDYEYYKSRKLNKNIDLE